MAHGNSRRAEAGERYEQLLQERICLGRRVIDHTCHPGAHRGAVELHQRVRAIETRLQRWRRWSWDSLVRVAAAEDDRWHAPGTLADCTLCIKEGAGLPVDLPLPRQAA